MTAPLLPRPRQFEQTGQRPLADGVLRVAGPRVGVVPVVDIQWVDDAAAADVVIELRPDWQAPFDAEGLSPSGIDVDETSSIAVRDDRLVLTAGTPIGAFRGLTAIAHGVDRAAGTVALFSATDGPAWRWRGLGFDAVRHGYTLDELRRVIDLAAWHQLNVVHLHLSDSQAWRLRLDAYPALTPDGKLAYSADELRELAAYAADRHVTVIPELDMPGHTHAAIKAYPELLGDEVPAHPFLAHLRPHVPAAMRFAEDVLAEACALFHGPYVHLGGDEAFGMDATEYAEFVTAAAGWVRARGKHPIGWQETARSGSMGAGDVIQMWIAPGDGMTIEQAEELAAKAPALRDALVEMVQGAVADPELARDSAAWLLVSSSNPFYLDRRYAEPSVRDDQNERMERIGMAAYPKRATSELHATRAAIVDTMADRPDRIAGFEAAIWAESIGSFDDLATLLLPRLAILAEAMWRPAPAPWDDVVSRVRGHDAAWTTLGFGEHYRSSEIWG